jgi:hypothetical protein
MVKRGTLNCEHILTTTAGNVITIRGTYQLDFPGAYPPVELEAHAQVPRHHPVPLDSCDEWVKPVQQQLSHSRLSKVLNAAIQPALEGVGVVSS